MKRTKFFQKFFVKLEHAGKQLGENHFNFANMDYFAMPHLDDEEVINIDLSEREGEETETDDVIVCDGVNLVRDVIHVDLTERDEEEAETREVNVRDVNLLDIINVDLSESEEEESETREVNVCDVNIVDIINVDLTESEGEEGEVSLLFGK